MCFLKDDDFDYKKENVEISVFCPEPCKFSLFTEVDEAYPLDLNVKFDLDFEDTAYTKIFVINTTDVEDFDELRIVLKPLGFLRYGEPILLLGNWGK